MELIDIKKDIKRILKKNLSESQCDYYIISDQTCTSLEVVYLFFIINRKYCIGYNELCSLLDDNLTINKLCIYIHNNRSKCQRKNEPCAHE